MVIHTITFVLLSYHSVYLKYDRHILSFAFNKNCLNAEMCVNMLLGPYACVSVVNSCHCWRNLVSSDTRENINRSMSSSFHCS